MATKFSGVIPPIPTMVSPEGSLDKRAMGACIDAVINAGVDGVLILGSAGEFFSMNEKLRKETAEFCVAHVASRVKTLVGTGACGTAEAISYARHAAGCGADGVMVINPYYSVMSDDCLYGYYSSIAESCEKPVLLYNFPAMTGQDLSIGLIRRLADNCVNIHGLKDSVTDFGHTRQVILEVKQAHPDFAVFAGFDDHMLPCLILGGDGGIPGTANFAPQIACGIYKAFSNGEFSTAFSLQRTISRLVQVYAVETPYFGTIKEAMRMCGIDVSPNVLQPSMPIKETGRKALRELLAQCGLL